MLGASGWITWKQHFLLENTYVWGQQVFSTRSNSPGREMAERTVFNPVHSPTFMKQLLHAGAQCGKRAPQGPCCCCCSISGLPAQDAGSPPEPSPAGALPTVGPGLQQEGGITVAKLSCDGNLPTRPAWGPGVRPSGEPCHPLSAPE